MVSGLCSSCARICDLSQSSLPRATAKAREADENAAAAADSEIRAARSTARVAAAAALEEAGVLGRVRRAGAGVWGSARRRHASGRPRRTLSGGERGAAATCPPLEFQLRDPLIAEIAVATAAGRSGVVGAGVSGGVSRVLATLCAVAPCSRVSSKMPRANSCSTVKMSRRHSSRACRRKLNTPLALHCAFEHVVNRAGALSGGVSARCRCCWCTFPLGGALVLAAAKLNSSLFVRATTPSKDGGSAGCGLVSSPPLGTLPPTFESHLRRSDAKVESVLRAT